MQQKAINGSDPNTDHYESARSSVLDRRVAPHVLVKRKVQLDDWAVEFLSYTRLAVVGTVDESGSIAVSPRGGPPGFIRVVDRATLVFDDLVGNNLMESHRNVLNNGRISLLCIVPGREETLRVRGLARLSYAPKAIPSTGIKVETRIDHWYYHCGRSMRLADVWNIDVIEGNKAIPFAKRPTPKEIV